jgi:hypothetical protein
LFHNLSGLACSALMIGALGCGSNPPATPDAGVQYNCATETRGETYAPGMMKTGSAGTVTFKLVTATPAPPARGDNTWVVDLSAAGQPLTGATVVVTPYMPDHRHGTPIVVAVTPTATAGEYALTPINLWMPGLWQMTIDATPAGGTKDSAMFSFCIAS